MTGETPDKFNRSLSGSPVEAPASGTLALDPDEFKDDLTELDLSDEQAKELLQTLWQIMSIFVDISWGVDSVQHLLPDLYKDVAPESGDLLESKDQASDNVSKEGPRK